MFDMFAIGIPMQTTSVLVLFKIQIALYWQVFGLSRSCVFCVFSKSSLFMWVFFLIIIVLNANFTPSVAQFSLDNPR